MKNLPMLIESQEVMKLVGSIAECYKTTKINEAIQETEREKIRQQARVYISQYENDTKKAIAEIEYIKSYNVEIIRTIGKILTKPDVEKEVIDVCKILLEYMK